MQAAIPSFVINAVVSFAINKLVEFGASVDFEKLKIETDVTVRNFVPGTFFDDIVAELADTIISKLENIALNAGAFEAIVQAAIRGDLALSLELLKSLLRNAFAGDEVMVANLS